MPRKPLHQPRQVETDLGPIEVAQLGNPTGVPALMVHGSPGGYDHGVLMGRFLARRGFRVIAPSRPGYLGTKLRSTTESPDDQADLLAALLDALKVDHAALLSWSGGGPAGYRLAARHPDRVRTLVALAALSTRYDWRTTCSDELLFGTLMGNGVLAGLVRAAPGRVVAGTLASEGNLDSAEVKARTQAIMADDERREFVLALAQAATLRGRRRPGVENDKRQFAMITDLGLAQVHTPTLLVQGDADTDVPPKFSDYAQTQISGAELLTMPGGTHLCLFVDPGYEAAQQRVAEFLAGGGCVVSGRNPAPATRGARTLGTAPTPDDRVPAPAHTPRAGPTAPTG